MLFWIGQALACPPSSPAFFYVDAAATSCLHFPQGFVAPTTSSYYTGASTYYSTGGYANPDQAVSVNLDHHPAVSIHNLCADPVTWQEQGCGDDCPFTVDIPAGETVSVPIPLPAEGEWSEHTVEMEAEGASVSLLTVEVWGGKNYSCDDGPDEESKGCTTSASTSGLMSMVGLLRRR